MHSLQQGADDTAARFPADRDDSTAGPQDAKYLADEGAPPCRYDRCEQVIGVVDEHEIKRGVGCRQLCKPCHFDLDWHARATSGRLRARRRRLVRHDRDGPTRRAYRGRERRHQPAIGTTDLRQLIALLDASDLEGEGMSLAVAIEPILHGSLARRSAGRRSLNNP